MRWLDSTATSTDAALLRQDATRVSRRAGTAVARRSETRGRRRTSTLVRLENRPAELAAQAHNLGLPGREPARACVLLEGVHVCRSVGTFRKRKLHTQINVVNTRAMPAGSSREDGRVLNCWNWTARVRHAVLDFTEEAAALRTRLALS